MKNVQFSVTNVKRFEKKTLEFLIVLLLLSATQLALSQNIDTQNQVDNGLIPEFKISELSHFAIAQDSELVFRINSNDLLSKANISSCTSFLDHGIGANSDSIQVRFKRFSFKVIDNQTQDVFESWKIKVIEENIFHITPVTDAIFPIHLTVVGYLANNVIDGTSSSCYKYLKTITIQPLPDLKGKLAIFNDPLGPISSRSDSRYRLISEDKVDDVKDSIFYNAAWRKDLRDIEMTGIDLIFQEGHENGLHDLLSVNNHNTRKLTIYADRVFFKNEFRVPRASITIYAREIHFLDDGAINTSPVPFEIRAQDAKRNAETGEVILAQNGYHGEKGGDVQIYADKILINEKPLSVYEYSMLEILGDPGKRIITKGGNGQLGGLGIVGRPGENLQNIFDQPDIPKFYKKRAKWYNKVVFLNEKTNEKVLLTKEISENTVCFDSFGFCNIDILSRRNGGDAVAPGRPGNAGEAGSISVTSNFQINYVVDNSGGLPGNPTPGISGGIAGLPNPAFSIRWKHYSPYPTPHSGWLNSYDARPGRSYPSLAAFDTSQGKKGILNYGFEKSWITPVCMRMIVEHIKDIYIYRYFHEAERQLHYYLNEVELLKKDSRQWGRFSAAWKKDINLIEEEMKSYLFKLENRIDYFENPPGYAPLLAYDVYQKAFEVEVDRSLEIMYYSYLIQEKSRQLDHRIEAMTLSRQKVIDDLRQMKTDYERNADNLSGLTNRLDKMVNLTAYVQRRAKGFEAKLLREAQNNVEKRHEVPFLKKALRTVGTIATVFPIGQPIVGQIGTSMRYLGDFNTDDPWSSIKAIPAYAKEFKESKAYQKQLTAFDAVIDSVDFSSRNSIKKWAGTVAELSKGLGERLNKLNDLKGEVSVPEGEIQAELNKLKARSTEYNGLIDTLNILLKQKSAFALEFHSTVTALDGILTQLHGGIVSIDKINDGLLKSGAAFDKEVQVVAKDLQQRAEERLLRYHYYLAKAFEYRLLKKVELSFDLRAVSRKILKILKAVDNDALLSREDFLAIKAVYMDQLAEFTSRIIDEYNNLSLSRSSGRKTFYLPEDIIDSLNSIGNRDALTINFWTDFSAFWSQSQEDVRIKDIQVKLKASNVNFDESSSTLGSADIIFEYMGTSIVEKHYQQYLFHHYNQNVRNPLTWGASYDGNKQELRQYEKSEPSEALLLDLLALENKWLFANPSINSNFSFYKEILTQDEDSKWEIDFVEVEIEYDYIPIPSQTKALFIESLPKNLRVPMIISQPDLGGFSNGFGAVKRYYTDGQQVTIEVPKNFEDYIFDGWYENEDKINGNPQLANHIVRTDQRLHAKYIEKSAWWIPIEEPGNAIPTGPEIEIKIEGREGLSIGSDGKIRIGSEILTDVRVDKFIEDGVIIIGSNGKQLLLKLEEMRDSNNKVELKPSGAILDFFKVPLNEKIKLRKGK